MRHAVQAAGLRVQPATKGVGVGVVIALRQSLSSFRPSSAAPRTYDPCMSIHMSMHMSMHMSIHRPSRAAPMPTTRARASPFSRGRASFRSRATRFSVDISEYADGDRRGAGTAMRWLASPKNWRRGRRCQVVVGIGRVPAIGVLWPVGRWLRRCPRSFKRQCSVRPSSAACRHGSRGHTDQGDRPSPHRRKKKKRRCSVPRPSRSSTGVGLR